MNKNTFDFRQVLSQEFVQDLIQGFVKEHPLCTAVGAGVGIGLAVGLPKLAPTLEKVGKYYVDKQVEYRLQSAAQQALTDDNVIDASSAEQPNTSIAA